jgi:hypothetical protein
MVFCIAEPVIEPRPNMLRYTGISLHPYMHIYRTIYQIKWEVRSIDQFPWMQISLQHKDSIIKLHTEY